MSSSGSQTHSTSNTRSLQIKFVYVMRDSAEVTSDICQIQ